MKRFSICLLLLLSATVSMAQSHGSDITSPFRLWLLNNEARVFSSLATDEILTGKVVSPFSLLPPTRLQTGKAEEKLWETHRKIYVLLDETQNIYSVARKYGNGRFAVITKQARPETWSLMPLLAATPEIIRTVSPLFRKTFHNTLLKSMNLDPERDIDLSARLNKALKKLSDEEFRLMNDYFGTFAALFPSDPSIRVLKSFIETGSRKPFGTGLKELLRPSVEPSAPTKVATAQAAEPDDPLAELEKLAQFDAGLTDSINPEPDSKADEKQPATLEPPPPGTEDLFNIWD